jgi:dihydropteroate synthase-like protein
MRILIVTSRMAEPLINEVVKEIKESFHNKDLMIDVVASKVPVAALMTTKDLDDLMDGLRDRLKLYDAVLVPGLLIGDIEIVCKKYDLRRCYKGSKYAGDLHKVIEALLNGVELSTREPADNILLRDEEDVSRRFFEERSLEAFYIKNLKIPKRSPPLLLAHEIVIKGDLDKDLKMFNKLYDKRYIDIIVVGTEVGSDRPEYIRKIFRDIIKMTDKPLAIDSLNIKEIEAAVSEEASLVMNLSRSFENWIDRLNMINSDLAYIVVPENVGGGTAIERAEACVKEYDYFYGKGLRKIILDPVIPPPLFGSIEALYSISLIKRRLENVPTLLGASNIYELIDADPVGIITFLTAMAVETGASLMLLTEESWKSKGSFDYASRSVELVHRAVKKRSPPIDVGVDVFIAKSKRGSAYINIPYENIQEIFQKIPPKRIDREKFFVVQPNYDEDLIEVYIFIKDDMKAKYLLKGRDPRSLGRKALQLAEIDDPEHAFYLGFEIARAYEALKTYKYYEQDSE